MTQRRCSGLAWVLLFLMGQAAYAVTADPPDPDKLRLTAAPVLTPQQDFDPGAGPAELTIRGAVRATDGLGAQDKRASGSNAPTFSLRARWTIFQGGGQVAEVTDALILREPFSYAPLPLKNGSGSREFVIVPDFVLRWNGQSPVGAQLDDGVYTWRLETCFIREFFNSRGVKEKVIDCAEPFDGTITIQSGPPRITIESPVDKLVTRLSTLQVSGVVKGCQPLAAALNGQALELQADGRFSTVLNLVEGSNLIRVTATNCRNQASVAEVTVFRDATAPAIQIDAPAPQFVTSVSPIQVQGRVTDAFGVQVVRVNGQAVPLVDGAFSGSVAVSQDGPVSITVCATDVAGNATVRIVSGTFDNHPPILTNVMPPDGALFKMDPIDVTGAIFDITKVGVSVNGIAATVTGSTFKAAVPLVQGVNTLQIVAVDAATNTTSVLRRVTLDLDKPSIRIASPANGARITTATPEILVTYHNGTSGIATETFRAFLDGQPLTAMTVTASEARLQIPSSQPLAPGLHVIDVTVADRVGRTNSDTSAFTVFSGLEPPVITPASSFALGKVLDGASGAPLANVQVSVRGQTGALLTNADGTYTFPASESGEVVLEYSRPGYTFAQRRVKTVLGRESAVAPVYLIPRSPAVRVLAAEGGTVRDPGGRIVVPFPPGALPADADIQLTDLFSGRVLPNFLPPQSRNPSTCRRSVSSPAWRSTCRFA